MGVVPPVVRLEEPGNGMTLKYRSRDETYECAWLAAAPAMQIGENQWGYPVFQNVLICECPRNMVGAGEQALVLTTTIDYCVACDKWSIVRGLEDEDDVEEGEGEDHTADGDASF